MKNILLLSAVALTVAGEAAMSEIYEQQDLNFAECMAGATIDYMITVAPEEDALMAIALIGRDAMVQMIAVDLLESKDENELWQAAESGNARAVFEELSSHETFGDNGSADQLLAQNIAECAEESY